VQWLLTWDEAKISVFNKLRWHDEKFWLVAEEMLDLEGQERT
jgi:hypothetical protein